jgi:16S rRNA processing protein RimM
MDGAAALKGALLLVEKSALPPLESDEYYLADLVGAQVRCRDERIGVVTAVRTYSTVDVLVIEMEDGRFVEQPVVDHWIQSVDWEAGLVLLASTEALIE